MTKNESEIECIISLSCFAQCLPVLCDFTAALVQNTQHTYIVLSMQFVHKHHWTQLEAYWPKSRTRSRDCNTFTVQMKFSALNTGFIIENKDFNIFHNYFLHNRINFWNCLLKILRKTSVIPIFVIFQIFI